MSFESMTLGLALYLMLVVLAAGLIQGALGFGFPFVATPLIAMVSDMRTAIIAVLLPTVACVLVALFASGPLRGTLARFWMMPLYAIAGAIVGTSVFVLAPNFPYALLLALITLFYLNLDRLGLGASPMVRQHERRFGLLAGLTAGLFEGTANVAGPPLIIYYLALGLAPAAMVQAMNICFIVGKTTQFTVMAAYGGVTAGQWLATIPLVVIAVSASLVGIRLRNRIDAPTYRLWVKRALLVIALGLLAQYAYSSLAR